MQPDSRSPTDAAPAPPTVASADDDRAVARYLYLLRTAPPEAIEQVHADAFRALTDAQRRELLERIGQVLPPYERALATPVNGSPVGLARLITRAEMRQPGTVERLFGPGTGVGRVVASGLLGGIAGAVAASAIAAPFLAGAALALAGASFGGASPAAGLPASDGSDSGSGSASDSGPDSDPDAGAAPADGAVADAGSIDDGGFDFGLDDLFDA
ncbi:MAG: hypothetical protein EHM87_13770 [Burkholderiales bacterium]|nr:MAG: hypothetical protein EHM87_13770 [Burkholderiales bacterium]